MLDIFKFKFLELSIHLSSLGILHVTGLELNKIDSFPITIMLLFVLIDVGIAKSMDIIF